MNRPRLAVFVSGTGRTLINLVRRRDRGEFSGEVVLVVASRECPGAQFARSRAIDTRVIPPRELTRERVESLLRDARADFAVLAGFLHLLPVPESYRGRVVNIHPALLPDFGGKGMHGLNVHQAVLASGRTQSGCTVHLCDDRYDTGPVIARAHCPVLPGDTPETLAARVFALELELLPAALETLFAQARRADA